MWVIAVIDLTDDTKMAGDFICDDAEAEGYVKRL